MDGAGFFLDIFNNFRIVWLNGANLSSISKVVIKEIAIRRLLFLNPGNNLIFVDYSSQKVEFWVSNFAVSKFKNISND